MNHRHAPHFSFLAGKGMAVLLAVLFLAGCGAFGGRGGSPPQAAPAAAGGGAYLMRARTQTGMQDGVTVHASVLRPLESAAHFGLQLEDKGVQPVWLEIENRGNRPYWLMRSFMDDSYYAPREVARLFHGQTAPDVLQAAERQLIEGAIRLHVPAGQTVKGFVYTRVDRGFKLMNVELLGLGHVLRFDLAEELPGDGFDFRASRLQRAQRHATQRTVALPELAQALRTMPCCTTDAAGTGQGDPLNIALVGEENDVLIALDRSGWDFTETINADSVTHMASAFVFGRAYRNSPVSPLYFNGQPQDLAMQRARADISQRGHLRLWLTSLRIAGQPVWIGQISRDIGVKLTTLSKTLTTHVIDPQVDHARFRLLETLLRNGHVERWGYVGGVGAASRGAPRTNLTQDPYFTDGERLVVFITRTPQAMDSARYIQWEVPGR